MARLITINGNEYVIILEIISLSYFLSLLFFSSKPSCVLFFLVIIFKYIYVAIPPMQAAKTDIPTACLIGKLNTLTQR